MNRKRILTLLLTAMLLLAGCGTANDNVSETTSESTEGTTSGETETETENTLLTDSVPTDLTFDGVTFRMYSPDQYDGPCMVEEETGEVLNDAKFKMELLTEDRLGVSIEETLAPYWDMLASVEQLVVSGDETYGCVTMMDRFALNLAQEGCILPMQNVPYVNLDAPYWGSQITKTLSVNGNSYFAVGSFNLRSFKDTACVMMNTTLAEDFGITPPHTLVDEGTWTFDKMAELGKDVTADLNGDGILNSDDRYGLGTYDIRSSPIFMWLAADIHVVDKDANDVPYLNVYGNEKFVSVMEWTYKNFVAGMDLPEVGNDVFGEGRELFCIGYFSHIVGLREMEDDFTVLPIPKWDEAQAEYRSRTYDAMCNMVPVTASDVELSGAVLEVLACMGHNYVVPAFIENSLMQKYSRDAESVKSIQIAFDTRVVDMAEAFMFDVFGNDATLAYITVPQLNTASWLESNRTKAEKELASIIKVLGKTE